MSGPVYVVVLADGRSLDTDSLERVEAWLHDFGSEVAETWCVDDFGEPNGAPKTLGGRSLEQVES